MRNGERERERERETREAKKRLEQEHLPVKMSDPLVHTSSTERWRLDDIFPLNPNFQLDHDE